MREGWRQTTLGEAVGVTMGRQRSPKHAVGEHIVPYLRAANVKDGRLVLDSVLEMNFSPAEQASFSLRPGDVLVTEGCGSIGQLGAAARWDGEIGGVVCFQNTLLRLRAVQGLTDPGFVGVWAQYAFSSGIFAAVASGTNIFHIGSTQAKQIPLVLPPLAEQRRLVDLIEAVESLGTKAQSVRSAQQAVLSGLSYQLIDRSEAPLLPLGEVATIEARLVDPTTPECRDLPHIGVERIESGTGRLLETVSAAEDGVTSAKYLFTADDVVYSKIRPNLRKVARPSTVGLSSADAYPLRTGRRLLADYLFEVLLSRSFSAQAVAKSGRTKMPKINRAELFSIPIPVPPLDSQAHIASLLRSVRDVRDRAATECVMTESLRSALLTDLLSGDHSIPAAYDVLLESAS